ncbi:ATP-binding protein [Sporosarcina cyprini]|uniref:ATP-binding protein n=1 Tax=Sporosarcina cyprini TaxID=2910523 RepID=UPI001EDCDD2D|nr:ATP-binding protein [Sporosarcina cyprini]MCG3089160.1 ATP-binding protein [Sporosarcina cyprini]
MQEIGGLLTLQTGITMESTSEVCGNHPYRKERPIHLMIIDGQKVCPVCESERRSEELSKKQSEIFERTFNSIAYNVFQKKSVLTDTGLLDASFKNYEVQAPEEIENKEKSVKAFKRYKKGEVFNTWFVGKPGVGKSHLSMSILRNLNESGNRDKSCLFASVDEMLLRIRNSFNDKETPFTEFYFVDLLSSVDYLVLDDLGAETGGIGTGKRATDFTMRVLYAIANGRQSKPTIITSNLTLPDLESMYDEKLISRLMRDTYLIRFQNTTDKRVRNITF